MISVLVTKIDVYVLFLEEINFFLSWLIKLDIFVVGFICSEGDQLLFAVLGEMVQGRAAPKVLYSFCLNLNAAFSHSPGAFCPFSLFKKS